MALCSCATGGEAETEVALCSGGAQCVSRLRRGLKSPSLQARAAIRAGGDGTWVVSGGLGGLGLCGASVLAQLEASRIVLTSRSGRVARDGQRLAARLEEVASAKVSVWVVATNGGDLGEASATAALSCALSGALHASGVLEDRLVQLTGSQQAVAVLSPKAEGARHLHSATATSAVTAAANATVGVFSYGSGAASSMYRLRARGSVRLNAVQDLLDSRTQRHAAEFDAVARRYTETYGRFD